MPLQNRIAELRKAKGWSRPALAARVGTSYQQIERLEKSQRRLSDHWIERLASALDVPAHEIVLDSLLPSEDQLAEILAAVIAEIPAGLSYADWPKFAAPALRERLEQFQADRATGDLEVERTD